MGMARAAEALAIEQSTGVDALGSYRARVVDVDEDNRIAKIAYPVANLGSIPALLVAVAGEVFETLGFDELWLLAIDLPVSWISQFAGPNFGTKGVRGKLGISDRPLLIAILKPSVGLSPQEAAELAEALARGGADIIKDDELNSTISGHDPVERARVVSRALFRISDRCTYVVNITGPVDKLADRVRAVSELDNVWMMVTEQAIGIDTLRVLSSQSRQPILCHRAYCGPMVRGGPFGVDASIIAGMTRIAGGDMIHCGGIGGKLFDSDEGVLASISSCRRILGDLRPSLPVIGGGYWAGSVEAVIRKTKTFEIGLIFGSGVIEHPDGPESGMRSVSIALDTVLQGKKIQSACGQRDFSRAVEHFGEIWT